MAFLFVTVPVTTCITHVRRSSCNVILASAAGKLSTFDSTRNLLHNVETSATPSYGLWAAVISLLCRIHNEFTWPLFSIKQSFKAPCTHIFQFKLDAFTTNTCSVKLPAHAWKRVLKPKRNFLHNIGLHIVPLAE